MSKKIYLKKYKWILWKDILDELNVEYLELININLKEK